MSWLLVCIVFIRSTSAEPKQCEGKIILEADARRIVHANWVNVTSTLICPATEYDWGVWYSNRAVYKQAIGCISDETRSLTLEAFPDVPFIAADFVSIKFKQTQRCIFSSSDGILTAIMIPDILKRDGVFVAENVIYFRRGELFQINFVICNKGEVRNGTCLVHTADGTLGDDRINVRMDNEYYRITGTVTPENTKQYECVVNLNRTFYQFSVTPKRDLNECEEAEKAGYHLCSKSVCVDLSPGYRCANNDYTDINLCKERENWFCPHTATYDYMKPGQCPSDGCIEAANEGISLCDGDVHDCIATDRSYHCKQGVPLLDVCQQYGVNFNLSCPTLSTDKSELARFGRSLKTIAYNAKTLYMSDPRNLLNLTAHLSDETINEELERHSEREREDLVKQLLDTVSITLNDDRSDNYPTSTVDASIPTHASTPMSTSKVGPPTSAGTSLRKNNNKVKSLSALLHMVAAITRRTPSVRQMIDEGKADRNGIKFMRISPGSTSVHSNVSDGVFVELLYQPENNEVGTEVIVAMVPEKHINGPYDAMIPVEPDEDEATKERAIIDSDVVLIDSASANSTYQLTVNLLQQPTNSLQCQQLRHSVSDPQQDWSSASCKTFIVGLRYECLCTSDQTGTFAIALVYWIGDVEIPNEINPMIDLLNYVFMGIAIVALFLFLTFSIFIGVFRLDQFNIALCLLLSAIVPLFVPHVNQNHTISCTIVAIAVCFFPLAAFSWKLIFGLNTLLLVVSPRSTYHDWVAKRNHCVPLLWIGYMIPAVIIGAWFGYAENVTHSGRCIGPANYRWAFIGPITAVVLFNFVVLVVVGIILLRSYLLTRKTRVTKSTHLLVLTQLMLTLGIPYVVIYLQYVSIRIMMIALPVAIALTSVLLFLLVAVIDQENRNRLIAFVHHHFVRSFGTKSNSANNRNGPRCTDPKVQVNCLDQKYSRPSDVNHGYRQAILREFTAKERLSSDIQDGSEPMLRELKDHDLQVQSNVPNSHVNFRRGWVHRIPASSYNSRDSIGNCSNARNSTTDEFGEIVLREAPIARAETNRSTITSAGSTETKMNKT